MTELPSPALLKQLFPIQNAFVHNSRKTARAIASGKDPRLLLIVGPCSIHNEESVLDYAAKLKKLSEEVSEACFIVMRAFFEKPRTVHGWNGMLYDPDLDGSGDISKGLFLTRRLLKHFADMHLPIACEFLDPIAAPYFSDLITWGIIGARTASSPLHRQLVSSLPLPCGFKNNLDGNWQPAIHGILTAKEAFSRMTINDEGKVCREITTGNSDSYLVLRGSNASINYDLASIHEALSDLRFHGLPERLMVDCSHGNSGKQADKQIEVFRSVLDYPKEKKEKIFGILLESFLEPGKQLLNADKNTLLYGVSVTDPCLDWASTKHLIEEAAALSCQS
ncbi:MAG: 3-deoxy-7-phosphoheptulonate synthase [Anaplasmataceae bacterium]|nr:3-deoxy-7-phosphoheptulonate synthase [Anaplasmataceae bacterium]